MRSLTAEKETLARQLALGRYVIILCPVLASSASHQYGFFFAPRISSDGTLSVDVAHVMLQTQLEQVSLELRQVTQHNQNLAAQVERLNRERTSLHQQQQQALKEIREQYQAALDSAREDKRLLEDQYEDLRAKMANLGTVATTHESQLRQTQSTIQHMEEAVADLKRELENAKRFVLLCPTTSSLFSFFSLSPLITHAAISTAS